MSGCVACISGRQVAANPATLLTRRRSMQSGQAIFVGSTESLGWYLQSQIEDLFSRTHLVPADLADHTPHAHGSFRPTAEKAAAR